MTVLGLACLLALVATVVLAAAWGARSLAGTDPLDRATAGALTGLAVIPLVGLGLGMVGLLHPWPTLLALVAVSAALALSLRRDRAGRAGAEVSWPSGFGLLCLVIGVAALAVSLRLGFDASRSLHHESHHYHFAAVAHFRDSGTIWTLPFENPSVFTASHPGIAEVMSAMLSFTTGSDRLLYGWVHAASAGLTLLGAAMLVRELGGRAVAGALAALAVLLCPLGIISVHSLANDLLPVAGLTAAAALVLRARAADAHRWTMACAGVALGLGLGSKYTAFVGAGLVVVAALVVGHGRRTLWLVPGAAVLGGPWLVRNLISFGNPLYPQPVRVGGVELLEGGTGPFDVISGTVLGHVLDRRSDAIDTWLDLVRLLCWPLAIAALVGALLVLPRAWRRDPRGAAAAALLGLGLIVAYLATPYTGAGVPPVLGVMGSNLRYLLPALVVGGALLAASLPKPVDLAAALGLVAWSVWKMFDRPMRPDLELTTPVLALALACTVAVVVAIAASEAWRADGDARRLHPAAALVWALPLVLVVGAVAADEREHDEPLTPLEAAVVRAAGEVGAADHAEVGVIGEDDVRSVVGEAFDRDLEQVTDVLEPAPLPAEELDRDVAEMEAPVLVVGGHEIGIPKDYAPPADAWCSSDATDDYTVYVRRELVPTCPPETGGAG